MRSLGSVSMMTPVENGSTWSGCRPSCAASATQVERARARPSAPVPAFALPVLTSSARMPGAVPRSMARCCWHSCTGAAQKRLRVNTPATCEPSASVTTSTSRRLALRTPAIVVPSCTPGTGFRSRGFGACRLTGIAGSWGDVQCAPERAQTSLPWQALYFLPLPQGQGSLRPTRGRLAAATAADSPPAAASEDWLPSSFGWV